MADKALVDEGKSDWASRNAQLLSRDYAKTLCVGQAGAPASGSDDREIARFCRQEGCDLLTGDKRAYTHMLDVEGVKEVRISQYHVDEMSHQKIYLITMY